MNRKILNILWLKSSLIAILLSSCGFRETDKFETECRRIARIEIIDSAGWEAYLTALRLYYKTNDQRDEYMKIWPIKDFNVRSDQSFITPRPDFKGMPYKNNYNVFMEDRLIARVINISRTSPSPASSIDRNCVYNYHQFYDLPRVANE